MQKLISWVEIPATDMDRAVKFYNTVFHLQLEVQDFGSEKMACFPTGEGAISLAPDFNPSDQGVLVSFSVTDTIEKSMDRATELGGSSVMSKTKIEAEGRGYFALIKDPEGNKIGLYEE